MAGCRTPEHPLRALPGGRIVSGDNPEQDVIDAIDALVDESLQRGPTDDYDRPWDERCEVCRGEWHGMVGEDGCPGVHAAAEEIEAYRADRQKRQIEDASGLGLFQHAVSIPVETIRIVDREGQTVWSGIMQFREWLGTYDLEAE